MYSNDMKSKEKKFSIQDSFFSSRRRHTRFSRDWSSDVCSSDLPSANGWPASLFSLERLGYRLAILFQQQLYTLLGTAERLLTLTGQFDALFKGLQRFFQRQLAAFHALYQLLQFSEGGFRGKDGGFGAHNQGSCTEPATLTPSPGAVNRSQLAQDQQQFCQGGAFLRQTSYTWAQLALNQGASVDLASLIGIVGALAIVIMAMILGGDISMFVNVPSILIVIVGSMFAVMVKFELGQFLGAVKVA